MAYGFDFRFLDEEQVFGDNKLDIFEKYGTKAAITDFSILLGGFNTDFHYTDEGRLRENRTCWWWTESISEYGNAIIVDESGSKDERSVTLRYGGARPFLPYSVISNNCTHIINSVCNVKEILYGEYPQMVADMEISFNDGDLNVTGKQYTTDSIHHSDSDSKFSKRVHDEYEYNGKKYIRFVGDENCAGEYLSNGVSVEIGKPYWICVEPIRWLVDNNMSIALSKKILFSGVQFSSYKDYNWGYGSPTIYQFMFHYFSFEIIPSNNINNEIGLNDKDVIDNLEKKSSDIDSSDITNNNLNMTLVNPYDLNMDSVSEDEIIRGCIDSSVPVFLHGASAEGKSARVKQIDPKLIKLSLAGITPEKLNGRSVYNSLRDTMEDKKPTWLERLESICSSKPDENHILFLDEISNALPSIQGMVYHLVLDREVNDRWPLPDNARIVLAGNEMKDSLAANKVVEPLFNRCAHVYIKTRLSDWLIWASETGIHPSIYSFMVYTNGRALRSKFDGEKPNADPRKWEMASKVLYSTGQPEMIRSLVGEEITREFCEFCNQKVITLDDVLKGNYDNNFISNLNTAEKYATVVGLSYVNKDNLEIVRDFVNNLGQEFVSVFDSIWCSGNEERLEIIAEMKMNQKVKKL